MDAASPHRTPDPESLVELRRCANEFKAGIVRSVLDDAGIESIVGPTEKTLPGVFGLTGFREAVVLVRREDLARAQAALDAKRRESVDLDWNEIDVGEPADSLARRIAESGRERPGWWRSGWRAAVLLFIISMVVLPFSAAAAWVVALAAIIAGAGSAGSWMISRARRAAPTPPPDDADPHTDQP